MILGLSNAAPVGSFRCRHVLLYFSVCMDVGKKEAEDRTRKGTRTEKLDRDICGISLWARTAIEKKRFTDVHNGGFNNFKLL